MEEDLRNVIQRRLWTVEQILPQAQELARRNSELPEELKKSIPHFSGEWSEDNVKNYIQRLDAAFKDPIRHKNRKLLEEIGLLTEGISAEILDNSLGNTSGYSQTTGTLLSSAVSTWFNLPCEDDFPFVVNFTVLPW